MRHFVHGPDGSKYGPADLPTLIQWKAENRLTPTTLIEPEVGGSSFQAKELPGLFPELQPPQQPYGQAAPTYAQYPYPQSRVNDSAKKLATATWILGAVSLLFCPIVVGFAAVVCAVTANQKGHPQGKILIGYAVGCTILGFILGAVMLGVATSMGLR